MSKAKLVKPITKESILITDVKEVYGAMYRGMQVFCRDGSIWNVISFKIGKYSLFGKFEKHED